MLTYVYVTFICVLLFLLQVPVYSAHFEENAKYSPNWASLDKRPIPSWYDEAKLGLFIHFGVFSVPSFHSEWFWDYWQGPDKKPDVLEYVKKNFKPDITYADFAKDFTADLFNPNDWVKLFNASGARYIVFTSKHHEGYCNWNTSHSFNWNSLDVGPKRNFVDELAQAIRANSSIRFGLYHSMYEWFNPLYLEDVKNNFTTNTFVRTKAMPELFELINQYRPELIWSDGDNGPDTYWNSTNFLAWLYNDSPVKDTVVVNDRWGSGTSCKHGGYWNCADRFNPGKLFPHKFENCRTLDNGSWGYRRDAKFSDYLTMEEVLEQLISTVSYGGNLLLNVGPRKDGMIEPMTSELLLQLGSWLKVNGEAIYSTRPWKYQKDKSTPKVWYTQKNTTIYAFFFNWPTEEANMIYLETPMVNYNTKIYLLGYSGALKFKCTTSPPTPGVMVYLPPLHSINVRFAWTLKFIGMLPEYERPLDLSHMTYFEQRDGLGESSFNELK